MKFWQFKIKHPFSMLLLLVAVLGSRGQSFWPFSFGNSETAVSVGGAPVGVYGRTTNPYGGSEEYAASLGGAPVGIYGQRNYPTPQYYLPYESQFCRTWPWMAYQQAPSEYYSEVEESSSYEVPERVSGVTPRIGGSISAASSSADFVDQQTKADSVSIQGSVPSQLLQKLLDF